MSSCRSPGPLQHGFPLSRELWLTRHRAVNSRWALSQTELKTGIFFPLPWNGLGLSVLSCLLLHRFGTDTTGWVQHILSSQPLFYWALIHLPFSPVTWYTHSSFYTHFTSGFLYGFIFPRPFAEVGKHLPFITRKLGLYCLLLWSLHGQASKSPFEILSTDFLFFHGEENTQTALIWP